MKVEYLKVLRMFLGTRMRKHIDYKSNTSHLDLAMNLAEETMVTRSS